MSWLRTKRFVRTMVDLSGKEYYHHLLTHLIIIIIINTHITASTTHYHTYTHSLYSILIRQMPRYSSRFTQHLSCACMSHEWSSYTIGLVIFTHHLRSIYTSIHNYTELLSHKTHTLISTYYKPCNTHHHIVVTYPCLLGSS